MKDIIIISNKIIKKWKIKTNCNKTKFDLCKLLIEGNTYHFRNDLDFKNKKFRTIILRPVDISICCMSVYVLINFKSKKEHHFIFFFFSSIFIRNLLHYYTFRGVKAKRFYVYITKEALRTFSLSLLDLDTCICTTVTSKKLGIEK